MLVVVAVGRVWLLIHKANAYHKLVAAQKKNGVFALNSLKTNHKLTIQYSQGSFITEVKSLRMQPCINGIYFEKTGQTFKGRHLHTIISNISSVPDFIAYYMEIPTTRVY